jgi:hypothetical protein
MMTVTCVPSRSPSAGWRFLHGAAVALALTVPGTVSAQPRLTGAAAADAKSKVVVPPGPLLAVVSLSKQRIRIYGSTGLLTQSPVSTGTVGHRTPAGVFSILQRSRFHRSNIYSNAPMPYMQRLTWSGVALHGGVVPGYPASHGCIRLPHHFASELWRMTKLGTRVVVAPDDASAVPIEHARLPAPRLTPVSADESGDGSPMANGAPVSTAGGPGTDAGAVPSKVRLLDPLQRVKATKNFVVKDAAAKTKAAALAVETAAAKAAEARRATAALRAAEQSLASARRLNEAAAKDLEAAAASAPAERDEDASAAAAAEVAAAERAVEEARLIEAMVSEDAAAAAAAVIETENARRDAVAALKASERGEGPISIFVSRKAGKVFIRQAWMPVHEAPVTFKDDGPAFGTHVYVAMGPSADGETMNWVSVSIPAPAPQPPRQRGKKPAQVPPASGVEQETAAGVLARFELPEATRRFIEDRLWPGASLIVSDYGVSGETGLYTDFIVLTR